MEYVSLEFNGDKYREAALLGNCDPPGVFTPFINVDLLRLDRLRNTSDPM